MSKKVMIGIMIMQVIFCNAQKRELDTSAISGWQYVDEGRISNDGKWATYRIVTGLFDKLERVIKPVNSVSSTKEFRIVCSSPVLFTEDSRYAVFDPPDKNELCLLKLGNDQPERIAGVSSFEMAGDKHNSYILYEQTATPGSIYIKEPLSGKTTVYKNVKNHRIVGCTLLLTVGTDDGGYELRLLDLVKGSTRVLWSGILSPLDVVVSADNENLAFRTGATMWISDLKKGTAATEFLLPQSSNLKGLTFRGIGGFQGSNNLLLLNYEGASTPKKKKDANPVQIFSFQDRTFDLNESFQPLRYQVIYEIASQKLTRLNDDGERTVSLSPKAKFVLINKQEYGSEHYWNRKQNNISCIKNVFNGLFVGKGFESVSLNDFSKDEYFFIYQPLVGDIYSLDIAAGKTINLTQDLPIPLVDNENESLEFSKSRGIMFAGWAPSSSNPNQILIYDHYDIWLIDVTAKNKPQCLTGGYGREHHIILRLADRAPSLLNKGDKVYLSAFDEENKDAGFYQVNWKDLSNPIVLSMGRYMYQGPQEIVKAGDKNRWLLCRQSVSESTNFYWTDDFKTFFPISDVHPEETYHWFTSELINYTTNDGVKSQAILFKPDGLDTTKRHPVLFNFYEHETLKLNLFQQPFYTSYFYFNFPMMLAQGYLVCVPDIHFKLGATARSIVDCVEGAADAIAARPYVDSTKYGASGGSFGGYGVNCLAAFSHKFKAIVPIAGLSDIISGYGNVPGLRDEEMENRQLRMGVSLSTAPLQYLENSPVAYARNVTTPILIVNNLLDGNVNVQQGIEWFISLRREGKPAWMLRYQVGGHGMGNLDLPNNKDLYLRMLHFFDHYLKGVPTPKWMMDSLPIWERSREEGFKLMPPGVEPGPGLNTEEDLQRRTNYLKEKSKIGSN